MKYDSGRGGGKSQEEEGEGEEEEGEGGGGGGGGGGKEGCFHPGKQVDEESMMPLCCCFLLPLFAIGCLAVSTNEQKAGRGR